MSDIWIILNSYHWQALTEQLLSSNKQEESWFTCMKPRWLIMTLFQQLCMFVFSVYSNMNCPQLDNSATEERGRNPAALLPEPEMPNVISGWLTLVDACVKCVWAVSHDWVCVCFASLSAAVLYCRVPGCIWLCNERSLQQKMKRCERCVCVCWGVA